MNYFTHPQKKVYWLPALLLFVLISVFTLTRFYLSQVEDQRRVALASVVAQQLANSLEVFSADRKRAIQDLVLSWPEHHPNPTDWFHTHASSMKNVLPGIDDVWWVKEDFSIRWSIAFEHQNELIGTHLTQYGIDVNTLEKIGEATGLISAKKLANLYAIQVDPNNASLGYVVASFDIKTTLAVLVGDLIGPQFNFSLFDGDTLLFEHGQLVDDTTIVTKQLGFAQRVWDLSLQSHSQTLVTSNVVFWVGTLMSCLISLFFFWQLRNAMQLGQSQRHYKAASEAALDSLFIYETLYSEDGSVTDFKVVDANKMATHSCKLDLANPMNQLLSQHLSVLGVAGLFQQIKQVSETGKPVEYTVENHSEMFDAKWLKLQFVRADRGLALTVRDISMRYQSQQQLKKSEARFRRLVDGLNRDFVYSMTPQGDITFVSTSVTKILGYEVNDFKLNARNYLHCAPDNIREIRLQQTKRQRTESYLLTYKSASGSLVSIECSDSPVFDENGKLVAIEGIGRDVTQDLIMKKKIFYQANHDPLTGLLNRYAFDSQLDKIIASLLDKHVSATLCYIDMDKFKLINDTCGHQAGDELLKNIATLLQQSLSKNDVLARVGGDEFCMILLDMSIQQAECKIQSLLDTVSAFRFMWQERVFHIGASVGIVQMGEKNISATELIKAADNACYKAKDNGRNQYVVHDNVQNDFVFRNEELALLEKVQTALDQDSFELYFQTIQPLCKHSHNISYEILLRMFDEDQQMVSPGIFIPVAERHGLMSRIDEWVFQHTLDLLEAHPIHVASLDKCSINLSGASLNSPTLMKKLLHRLKQTSVPKEKLCFEITETSAVTNLVKASHVIDEIRALGCAFSLDDFGAGMCSFTYLKNMNVDYVKIDGSFVKNMVNDPCDLATVKAIHEIANSMGKETIAEFVGDKATILALKKLGVHYAQGFAISKPQPFACFLSTTSMPKEAC